MAKRIISIDDDQDILDCIQIILTGEGYDVSTSLSPANIFQQIKTSKPDLILLDISIGRFNGLEICKQIKANSLSAHIPVIIISGESEIFRSVNAFGAMDFIPKPFDIANLAAKVNNALKSTLTKTLISDYPQLPN